MDNTLTVTFLGTGTSQGIPIIGSDHPVCLSDDPRDTRLRVSVLLSWNNLNYVIDCGPDFRQQMLTHKVQRLDGLLFTHEHADHTAGVDDIRPFYFRQGEIPIYAHARVIASLEKRFDYIFVKENKYPGAPGVGINEVRKDVPFALESTPVIPIEAHHDKLPVLGYRIKDFIYLTDVKRVEQDQMELLKNAKVLVVNALRIDSHQSHFNLQEALDFAKEVGAEKTYFTHISHMLGFHAEVEKQLPENVFLAYDNLKITL